ncbi:uncharacterized protein N7482_005508 [Penicillium canariense]|uniref:Ankyrin repeat-containing domain protein n=1 Tax=Penicillium canariense TaxID=189055 RepID=A0A9W9I830_9EURO|nr:uncharacterized protein N7482_005508 [Penicillium canariense]KAJ5166727.1 hypothetical protein N7482_005508 [Penicillium canariense]
MRQPKMAAPEPSTSITYTQGGAVFKDISANRDIIINHISEIRPLADELNASFFGSSDVFKSVQEELSLLISLLVVTTRRYHEFNLDDENLIELGNELQKCNQTLKELHDLKQYYDDLPSRSKIPWERMKLGASPLVEIRARIAASRQIITVLNTDMIASSQANVERLLKKFIQEQQNELTEGSVISSLSSGSLSLDDKETWRRIRKELQGVGMTPEAFDKNRAFILDTLAETFIERHTVEDIDGDGRQSTRGSIFSEASVIPLHTGAYNPVEGTLLQDRKGEISKARPKAKPNRASQFSRLVYRLTSSRDEFLEAVQTGDLSLVIRCLERGVDIDSQISRGKTALVIAAENGFEEIVETLLAQGISILRRENGYRALAAAASNGNERVVQMLLRAGVPTHQTTHEDPPGLPIVQAVRSNHSQVLRLLLNHGAGINHASFSGLTALMWASMLGYEDPSRILLETGAKVDLHATRDGFAVVPGTGTTFNYQEGQTALLLATQRRHEAIVALLLSYGADVLWTTSLSRTALHEALIRPVGGENDCAKQLEVVKILFQYGANTAVNWTDKSERTPLLYAVRESTPDMVKLLLDNGADVNHETTTSMRPLLRAASFGSTAIVDILLHAGAEVNAKNAHGETALWDAVRCDNISVAKLLLQHGAEANVHNNYGETVLLEAVKEELEEMALMLIQHGTDPNLRDKDGVVPLLHAVGQDNCPMTKILVQNGADINIQGHHGESALFFAVRTNSIAMAELLLEMGADPNLRNSKGETPLLDGLDQLDHAAMVELLLRKGADPNSKSSHGEPAIFVALRCFSELHPVPSQSKIDLLLKYGAGPNSLSPTGETILNEAIKKKKADVVRTLLDSGASVHWPNKREQTPLSMVEQMLQGQHRKEEDLYLPGGRRSDKDLDQINIFLEAYRTPIRTVKVEE